MNRPSSLFVGGLLALALAGCAGLKPSPGRVGSDRDLLYLALMWHQHQPMYAKDPDTGAYTRPWVRVHATKDYYDMAAILEQYPEVKATFNLTPVLIRQLDDFAAGAKDLYWVLAEKPAASLSREDKRFVLQRFFDANYSHVIGRFPRYQELLEKRGGDGEREIETALGSFSVEDFRDLQVWFNLAWFDPDFLQRPPLQQLVQKGRGFSEQDKGVLFSEALKVIRSVIPEHRKLQDRGQIEVITTPYAHPLLPLLYNSDLASKGDPGAELPQRYSYPQDVIAQLARSVEIYRAHFGRKPQGLWPAEGAVGQEIVKLVADAGYRWMASGEQVLAQSLGLGGFNRDSAELTRQADELYRPYYVQYRNGPRVGMVFRDNRLSDLIGFEYSGTPGEVAAEDFMQRLEAIRQELRRNGAEGPHLVSVILDGENAWEYYPNDGKEFLHALYRKLSESRTIRTVTPSEFLQMFPEQRELDQLWWGCWFTPDYSTWIGEPEENLAWDYLGRTRSALAQYDFYRRKSTTPERLARAQDLMYLAEGSDWFWWYGSDQDSGVDESFDGCFRSLLSGVYGALGGPVPDFLRVPIIPTPPATTTAPGATPTPPTRCSRRACSTSSGSPLPRTRRTSSSPSRRADPSPMSGDPGSTCPCRPSISTSTLTPARGGGLAGCWRAATPLCPKATAGTTPSGWRAGTRRSCGPIRPGGPWSCPVRL
jgi:alpha-amylase/alpha-mannosidase (GH57 family)